MIASAKGHNNHAPSDLNFEVNLRSWKLGKKDASQQEKPFKYPVYE